MFSLAQMIAVCVISFLGGVLAFMIAIICFIEIRGVQVTLTCSDRIEIFSTMKGEIEDGTEEDEESAL